MRMKSGYMLCAFWVVGVAQMSDAHSPLSSLSNWLPHYSFLLSALSVPSHHSVSCWLIHKVVMTDNGFCILIKGFMSYS